MLEYITEEANAALTENGALTHATTGSDCLDLFATVGALRGADDAEIERRFMRAFAEDPDLAMKLAFYARDVRGGLGERRAFRVMLRWLSKNAPASARKNAPHIAEYGRFDDLLTLLDTPCETEALVCVKAQLSSDLEALKEGDEAPVSLLGKWLPSVNASCPATVALARRMAKALGMNDAQYRRTLSALRKRIDILENHLRERDYSFDYSRQPSQAMYRHRQAFFRNDEARYRAFLNRVAGGEATLHTGTLTPYEIISPFFGNYGVGHVSEEVRRAADVTWNALEDFTRGENALVVADGSGSMYGRYGGGPLPAAVAQSLAIYFAERNRGAFHGSFITFSRTPKLVEVKGRDIFEKVRYCASFSEVANTNVLAVFKLVLAAAVKHQVPQEELPSTLYFISDMEFDRCAEDAEMTNFQHAKKLFAQRGYELPRVVFWNVSSRNQQQPVTMNEQGVALVSGSSPRVFAMLKNGTLDPYGFMMDVLGGERYAKIVA